MKLKWLLIPLCLLFIMQSCRKDNYKPGHNNSGNVDTGKTDTTPKPVIHKLSVNNVLQSNMVVQRNKPFTVWGLASGGVVVTLNASWNPSALTATADATGKWSIIIPSAPANTTPQTITVNDNKTTVKLDNILIGDVWICAGQSNMVFEVDSIAPFRGVLNYPAEIAAANYPSIRAITPQPDYENKPVDSLVKSASWQVCSPTTVGNWSAVAYYFAQKLNTSLNVPVGIIISAVDGTSCEAWTSQATFQSNSALSSIYYGINNSTQLYNGMINPFINLPVSGFIWYQGENNRHNDPPSNYTLLNSAMINGWRNAFNQGQLPFYFVQMPPFAVDYFSTDPVGGNLLLDDYAKFREAQANVLSVAGTGMAVTMDVGEPPNQHPRNKKPVGDRLALLALRNAYGENVQCYGPQFSSYNTSGATATVSFKPGTADGLGTPGNAPLNQYFFVAGTDHNFVQATAVIQGGQVVLTAPSSVPLPIQAVRYAFTNEPVTNLQNSAGLPAEPFRTDNWTN